MCEHLRHKAASSDAHTVNMASTAPKPLAGLSISRARGMGRPGGSANAISPSTKGTEKSWQGNKTVDKIGRPKSNSTERNIYALDYNCNPSGALASGLDRSHWWRSDPSFARDCGRCARYSTDSRQTALSESADL